MKLLILLSLNRHGSNTLNKVVEVFSFMKHHLYVKDRKAGGNVGLCTGNYLHGNKDEAIGCGTFIWTLAWETVRKRGRKKGI